MTIKELIEHLRAYNPEMKVVVWHGPPDDEYKEPVIDIRPVGSDLGDVILAVALE